MRAMPNKRGGGDGGTACLWRAGRPRPAAPHHERWATLLMRWTFFAFSILTLAWSVPGAEEVNSDPDRRRKVEAAFFQAYLHWQTNATWHLQNSNFLAITAFPEGLRSGLRYVVHENGVEFDVRYVHLWASQAKHSKQLSVSQVKDLRTAIGELPSESKSPPVERLVMVSFLENTNWVTRFYDTDAFPNAMRKIYDTVGERFESKKTK